MTSYRAQEDAEVFPDDKEIVERVLTEYSVKVQGGK